MLANGRVLVTGGATGSADPINSTELYDSDNGSWRTTGSLKTPRREHKATLLANGNVLVTGGDNANNSTVSAELYNPATGTWITTNGPNTPRADHTATLLPNGKVLVVGGYNGYSASSYLTNAELYDPASGIWASAGLLNTPRAVHTSTLLPNGKVLVVGGLGTNDIYLASAELWSQCQFDVHNLERKLLPH